ncbi:hypothetical protein LCGC14_1186730 [marine sediment metagenome]|uniref:Peptidoglycan binding-like domain-containing protein n=1 Tax=marine sediment metagenome TaxID=412755 RepID=A0A0F9P3C3_9ZZZZ
MITPAMRRIREAILDEFADEFADGRLVSGGIYNRRRMRRFWLWSQHAWGNAWDVKVAVSERHRGGAGDRLREWLRRERLAWRLPVERVLWRIISHYDHLHIVGAPRMKGTPPLAGTEEDIDMEALKALVEGIQQSLVDAGYRLPNYGVDGVWGDETAAAFALMATDAGSVMGPRGGHYHTIANQTSRAHKT